MSRPLLLVSLAAVLSFAPGAWAQAVAVEKAPVAQEAPNFLRATPLELMKRLPPAPEVGSLAALADLEAVLQVQAWRTPEQVAWADVVDKWSALDFAPVLGPWFTEANLPATAALMKAATGDLRPVSREIKKHYDRPRPPKVDPRVQPTVPVPTSGSYPSGHTLHIFVEAGVLAEIYPECREALMARAHRAAWGRIIGGVHFPTDVVGGRLLAAMIVEDMKQSEAFRQAVAACRREAETFLLKKAS